MQERLIEESRVRSVIHAPDSAEDDPRHGGRLLTRYLPDWDRILVVAVEERAAEGLLLVKTVLWSKAS